MILNRQAQHYKTGEGSGRARILNLISTPNRVGVHHGQTWLRTDPHQPIPPKNFLLLMPC
jgi:hypothetical protein